MTEPVPPRSRGRLARRLTAAAALGRFELPVCQDCQAIQYPVQEICGVCLSSNLKWQKIAGQGEVLAATSIHHSVDPYMSGRVPIPMGTVKLDGGVVVFAFIAEGCSQSGTRVRILNRLDRSGESVLLAVPENAAEDVMVLPDPNREIAGKVVLIGGVSDEVARALADAFKNAGAAKILTDADLPPREPVDVLINNMSANKRTSFLAAASSEPAREEMERNYFHLLDVVRAVAPGMCQRKQGVILNVLTVLSHFSDPVMGSFCASQAAALSVTQAVRAEVAPFGVRVCGLFPGPVDTAVNASMPPPKLSPSALAQAAIAMIRNGIEDHYPGTAEEMYAAFCESPKALEREMALRVV
jgi:NAD(P)-dependent dehydrogenase (short-subunit alcohol dehydrogenase family)